MKAAERHAARQSGQLTYFTGRPCKSGHVAERQVSNGCCVVCRLDRLRAHRKTDLGRQTSRRCAADWYRKNGSKPEVMAEAIRRASEWFRKNKHLDRVKESKRRAARKYSSTAHGKEKNAAYMRERRRSDPQFKLRNILRLRLYHAVNGAKRPVSAITLLGCSIAEAMAHIEKQFSPGMTWENWGHSGAHCWHIDHIRPLASFDLTDAQQIAQACHFSNLQPLWAFDNLSKGAKVLQCAR